MKLLNGRSVLTISLLAATSGFAATIGSFAEASSDTTALIVTQWGIPQGSYILNLNQTALAAAASSAVGAVAPTIPVSSNSPTTTTTTTTTNPETSTNRPPSAPIFIMEPNLGFRVVLTADYSFQADTVYTGPINWLGTPTNTQAGGNQPYTLTTSDVSLLGVSNSFTGAPMTGTQVSDAGALFSGDSASAPTVLTSTTTVPRGFTPTTTTAPPTTTTTTSTTTTSPTASSPDTPTSGTPQQQLDQIAAAAVAPVPEPSTAVGFSLALAGLGWLKHRSSKKK